MAYQNYFILGQNSALIRGQMSVIGDAAQSATH